MDRGFELLPLAFTGSGSPAEMTVKGKKNTQVVKLAQGPGIEGSIAYSQLKELKKVKLLIVLFFF